MSRPSITAELHECATQLSRGGTDCGVTDALECIADEIDAEHARRMDQIGNVGEAMIKVEILRHPTDEDWKRCKLEALTTMGRNHVKSLPDESWKYLILRARHSVIYTLMFTLRITEEPYDTAMHFKTHHVGCVQFVSSQRKERQDKYDRDKAPQDAPVTHVIDVDACALMNMANKRLCSCASDRTRRYMQAMCQEVLKVNPEFRPFLVPFCMEYGCHEFRPCSDATRYLP